MVKLIMEVLKHCNVIECEYMNGRRCIFFGSIYAQMIVLRWSSDGVACVAGYVDWTLSTETASRGAASPVAVRIDGAQKAYL